MKCGIEILKGVVILKISFDGNKIIIESNSDEKMSLIEDENGNIIITQ